MPKYFFIQKQFVYLSLHRLDLRLGNLPKARLQHNRMRVGRFFKMKATHFEISNGVVAELNKTKSPIMVRKPTTFQTVMGHFYLMLITFYLLIYILWKD